MYNLNMQLKGHFNTLVKNMLSPISFDVGIDLGTANTRVGVKDPTHIKIEPSVVAINKATNDILAVGQKAKNMLGKTPANVVAVRPLKDGVIVDFETTLAMLKHFISVARELALTSNPLAKPRVLIGVPITVTDVEKEATIDAAIYAGAKEAYVIEEPIAAAIGIGLPINTPSGNMVVDIGGGTTDITIISLGGIVIDKTIKIAGDEMDDAIMEYVKNQYNLLIGPQSAEVLKKQLGNLMPDPNHPQKAIVHGVDMNTRLPKSLDVSDIDIAEALHPIISRITDSIKEAFEEAPPEIVADLRERGLVITGGASQLKNLDVFWTQELHIKVKRAPEPQLSVLKGILNALDNIEYIRKIQEKPLI